MSATNLQGYRAWLAAVERELRAAGLDVDVFGSDDLMFLFRRKDSPATVAQLARTEWKHVSADHHERTVR